MGEKSETCFGKSTGEPLTEYSSEEEAQEGADYANENYENTVNSKVNYENIMESIRLIMDCGVDYEFRTTVVPKHFDLNEAIKIGKMLKGAKKYVLQQYRNSDKVLDEEYQKIQTYISKDFNMFKELLDKYIDNVEIRGID